MIVKGTVADVHWQELDRVSVGRKGVISNWGRRQMLRCEEQTEK